MGLLSLDEVTKSYPAEPLPAVDHLSLALEKGGIMVLLGPSGCGKTTTLRLIAGFERPEAEVVKVAGKIMTNGPIYVPPEQRGVGVVFLEYTLFSLVACFLGQANFLPGMVGKAGIETDIGTFPKPLGLTEGSSVEVMMQPHQLALRLDATGNGVVTSRRFRGVDAVVVIQLPSGLTLYSCQPSTLATQTGERVNSLGKALS